MFITSYGGKVIPLTGFYYFITAAIVHRTVTELFVRDIYFCKLLDFKSIHEHEKYIDICLCLLINVTVNAMYDGHTWLLALFCPFCCPHTALIVPLLLSVHRVNSALFLSYAALIVPFFFRSPR